MHHTSMGIRYALAGTRVLITGGTGTFGRRMLRELLRMPDGPDSVVVLSRDELKQSKIWEDHEHDPRLRMFLGDVRDRARLEHAFRGVDVVIHAAALKQVPAAEYNPTEAVATNVQGAINVVDAAISAGVRRVVALSTDKACEPVNLYGATKAVAEKVFLAAHNLVGALGEPKFAVTRYGNVAASRGSVLEVWRYALAQPEDAPGRVVLKVTDPACTRFWMTPAEAVRMVLWTIAHMEGGETVVPELPAYRVHDLAHAATRIYSTTEPGLVTYQTTGMRPGEKMHETMISRHEVSEYQARHGTDEETMYWVRDPHNPPANVRHSPLESEHARRMSVAELEDRIKNLVGMGEYA